MPPSRPASLPWRGLAVQAALTLLYFAAGKLGLKLAFVHTNASAVWPPTGIAMAALIVLGLRLWPGVFVGAFLVNATTAGSLWTSLGIASGNTLEALLGAYLVRRLANGPEAFDRPSTIFRFVVLAAGASTAVSATLGVATLALGGLAKRSDVGSIWLTWWLGDAVGAVVVAPLLIVWSRRGAAAFRWRPALGLEALLVAFLVCAVGLLVFGDPFRWEVANDPLEFLCIPPLIWAAFRLGPRGVTAATVALSTIAIWGTLRGHGPFGGESRAESLLLLQTFMGITSILGLTVAAVISGWRQAEERVHRLNTELEARVAERTDELRDSEGRIRAILETAHHAFIAMDTTGRIVEWNPAAEAMFGWSRNEARGRILGETIVPVCHRQAHYQGIERLLRTGEAVVLDKRLELSALHRDGHEFPVALTISALSVGESTLFHAFLEDIRDRKTVERMREDITRAMVHDLRSPLTAIRGCLDQLDMNLPPTGLDRQMVDMARGSSERLINLVQAILDMSRLETGKMPIVPAEAGLASLVDEALDLQRPLAIAKELRLGSDVTSDCRVLADPGLLRQVLQNLIGNAIKFTPPGGAVRVGATFEGSDPPMVRISVKDSGTGIPHEVRARLFEKFVAGPQPGRGSGLGLAFCRLAVEAHRGRIWVESQPGTGATFLFTLPAAS